jgi:putative transposase
VLRTFKYPLLPNISQECTLDDWRQQCCTLYNAALEQRITWWRSQQRTVTRFDQTAELTDLRAADSAWSAVPVEVQRSALRRLDLAYAAFFRRVARGEKSGFPRFRSVRRYDSFDFGCVKVTKDRVHIPKLGHVKMNLYRPIEGTIKRATIKRDNAGKWWVNFQCDLGPAPAKCEIRSSVGIDLGLTNLATRSDGKTIANHRFGKRATDLLAKRQRNLARKQKGSKNREKARILVAKAHSHVANQRLDQARKEAKKLFEEFDEVSYEDLSVQKLASGRFSKSMHDAAWGVFNRCCASKAEYAGKHHTPRDHRRTSQRCNQCGTRVKLTLAERTFRCPSCGLEIDRDHNAAINIRSARPGRSGADKGRARPTRAGPVSVEGKASPN